MKIGGLQKQSLQDYPEKISAVIFTQGCNFRCGYCHNPELVLPEKMQASMPEKEILRYLESRKDWLQGVVITGGEPTVQRGLKAFIQQVKKLGYAVKLDTNGTNPSVVRELINQELIDYVAMDLKAPLQLDAQRKVAGKHISQEMVARMQETKELLQTSKVEHEFRTTAISGVHTQEELLQIGRSTKKSPYYLQRFRPQKTLDPSWKQYTHVPEANLQALREELSNAYIRE